MEYKIDKKELLEIMVQWNQFLKRRVHLIASKLIRGTGVDFADCLLLVKSRLGNIDLKRLVGHYRKLVSYDIAEARVGVHIDHFIELLRKENLYD